MPTSFEPGPSDNTVSRREPTEGAGIGIECIIGYRYRQPGQVAQGTLLGLLAERIAIGVADTGSEQQRALANSVSARWLAIVSCTPS